MYETFTIRKEGDNLILVQPEWPYEVEFHKDFIMYADKQSVVIDGDEIKISVSNAEATYVLTGANRDNEIFGAKLLHGRVDNEKTK